MEEEKERLAQIRSKLGTNPNLADDGVVPLTSPVAAPQLRPLTMGDFLFALTKKAAASEIFEFPF